MSIVKITSNIKSPDGEEWSHEIGPLNLLIGPNESGKSAIAEAIQLAVSGKAYGLFFRNKEIKAGNQLVDLGPLDSKLIFAEAEFADGSTSRWEMVPGKRPKQTGKTATALPIAELREALGGSPQRARAFFAKHLLPEVSRKDLEELLADPEYDLTIPLEVLIPDNGGPITGEQLSETPSEAGSWKRKAQAEGKAASALLATFAGAEKVENSDIYATWELLFKALRFEWSRKEYKRSEDPAEKAYLKNLALSLGTKEELKNLDGSAQYSEQLEVLMHQSALYGAAGRARDTVKQSEQAAAEFDALAKKLDRALTVLLVDPLKKYIKQVNKFLPKGDRFNIIHHEKHFKVCLHRGKMGHAHTALSGSAEARTLAAMGASLSDDNPAVIILDDRMWDTATLAKTMEKLEKAPCQVVLMTTTSPRGRKRSAWNYIEVSRNDSEEEVDEEVPPAVPSGANEDLLFA